MSRIEPLKAMVAANPVDSRIRFMLAMEYMGEKDYPNAINEFDALIGIDPDYVAAQFQAGRCSEARGDLDAARGYYQRGIEAAQRTGNKHAEAEISDALAFLG